MGNQIIRGFVPASTLGSFNAKFFWNVTEDVAKRGGATVAYLNMASKAVQTAGEVPVYDTTAEALAAIAGSGFDGEVYVGDYMTAAAAGKLKDVDVYRYVSPDNLYPGKPSIMPKAKADAKNRQYAERDARRAGGAQVAALVTTKAPAKKAPAKRKKTAKRSF